jgi:FMN phosphatase YigB (HAD superfamily)
MRIALDIDSTLYHYWGLFADAAQARFGVHLPYNEQSVWEIEQLRPEQLKAVIAETHRDENITGAEPYPGAVETIRAWHDAGHFIHVTSHRAEGCAKATEAWLADIGLVYDELYCSWDKVTRCCEIGIDLLVDDSPVNLEKALDAGIRTATISHPWNREICEMDDVICATDWPQLRAELAPLLEPERAEATGRA